MADFSWDSMVRSADKDFEKSQYVYEFAEDRISGMIARRFYDSGPHSGVYSSGEGYLVDADGNYIVDADGNKIKVMI